MANLNAAGEGNSSRRRTTTLHNAAWRGDLELVRFLVENGADIDAKDVDGETPLHWAARQGHLAVVQYLVEQRADVNATNDHGTTPRALAAQGGHTDVVAYLRSKGG